MKALTFNFLLIILSFQAFGQTKEYTRKAYVCDYCTEFKWKAVDISTTTKVEEFLCSHYWYAMIHSTSGPATVGAEIVFKGDRTLAIYESNGNKYSGVYTISQSEVYKFPGSSGKTTNRVFITGKFYGYEFFPDGLDFKYSLFAYSGENIFIGDNNNSIAWAVGYDASKSIADKAMKKEAELAAATQITATYNGYEFIGYYLIHFTTSTGETIHFKNPTNIEAYAAGPGEMKLADQYVGKIFRIKYTTGKVEVYSEDSGQSSTIEDDVIVTITLVE